MTDTAPAALDLKATAKAIGLGLTKTRELVATGEIPSFKVGRRVLIPADAPTAWVARQLHQDGA